MLLKKVSGTVISALFLVSIINFSFTGNLNVSSAYVSFGAITVSGDADLLSQASTNGWTGNGSASNPIIIEGYNISTNPGITFSDTTLYVKFRNMFLQDAGITITNATNLMFDSVALQTTSATIGMLVQDSGNLSFTNMTATGQLKILNSDKVMISNTTVSDTLGSAMGITIESSSNVMINSTVLNNIAKSGINVASSENVTISGISVSMTGENGMAVTSSKRIDISSIIVNGGIAANDLVFWNNEIATINGFTSFKKQGFSIMDVYNSNNTMIQNVNVNESFGTMYLRNSFNMTVENVEINSTQNHGVRGILLDNFTMKGVTVKESKFSGTYISNSSRVALSGIYMMNSNQTGILFDYSNGINVNNSTVSGNRDYGVLVRVSSNANLTNIMATGNGNNASIASGIGSEFSENITIKSNTVTSNIYAGILTSGKNIWISKNTVSANGHHGITGAITNGMQVIENTIKNNVEHGIFFISSNNQTFINNTISGNGGYGLHVSVGENLTLSGNEVTNSGNYGIFVNGITYAGLMDNIVENTANTGFVIRLSTNVTATYNTIFNSSKDGIFIESSKNTTVSMNNFLENSAYGAVIFGNNENVSISGNNFINNMIPQGQDNSSGMLWKGNYWSDHTSPDGNKDGIVDTPYSISGTANATDPEPLTTVTEGFDNYDYLTNVKLLSPTGGETLNETITITWSTAVAGMSASVKYDLFYSSDGSTWKIIVENLSNTSYEWATFGMDNGSYQIKVIAKSGSRMKEDISPTFTILNIHKISGLHINSPSENGNVSGMVTISWTAASNSFPYSIVYTVEYSTDGGKSWKLIASGLNSLTVSWNTTEVPNGNVTIRVTATDQQGVTAQQLVHVTIENKSSIISTSPTTTATTATSSSTNQTTSKEEKKTNVVLIGVISVIGIVAVFFVAFRKQVLGFFKK